MSGLPARCMGVCRTNKCRIITSDVLQLGAAVLMIITLAITVNNPTSSLSWSKFSSDSQRQQHTRQHHHTTATQHTHPAPHSICHGHEQQRTLCTPLTR